MYPWCVSIHLFRSQQMSYRVVQMDNYLRQPFLLFGTLFEATMVDKQLEKKTIYFELSIG